MRIAIASDLHVEFDADHYAQLKRYAARTAASAEITLELQADLERYEAPRSALGHPNYGPDWRGAREAGTDLVLLAGDIHNGLESVQYAGEVQRFLGCPVALIDGNHDLWGGDLTRTIDAQRAEAAKYPGVHFLECDRLDLVIDSRRVAILGATLWTDYALYGADHAPHAMRIAKREINDFGRISAGEHFVSPEQLQSLHRETVDWLHREVPAARAESDVVIIMSHHAPSRSSEPSATRPFELCPAYASDLDAEIELWKADLWAYGHIHQQRQFTIGDTRLVNWTRGYIGHQEQAVHFEPTILEL